jgi:uncharacterized membrane protein
MTDSKRRCVTRWTFLRLTLILLGLLIRRRLARAVVQEEGLDLVLLLLGFLVWAHLARHL